MIGTWRVLEHHLMVYRRTWKGGMFVSFASPILFLAAMGIGLGSLIARGPVRTVGGVSYLAFLAPGLLAATAMQTAFVEETYPIMAKLQWLRTYDGMGGEIGWLAVRQAITAIAFFIVLVIFGTVSSVAAVLMIPVAVLNGLAFGLPIMAFSATQRKDKGFPVIGRFIITPLFLLGGVFFPIQRLPQLAQVIAWLTPLAHSVALARSLAIGGSNGSAAIHLAVPATYVVVGIAAAGITLRRRLVQ
ncbi:MAG: ABC transporter [Chloroflexi bacterium]|nr:MAG: ABC transporter [Chloroflexota bacterium]